MEAGLGTIGEIYAAMADLEQPVLEALDADFKAYDFVPPYGESSTLKYPFSFRLPPRWQLQDRGMGSGSIKPFSITIYVIVLVGLSSNELGPLTAEAEQYIQPIYELYMGNRGIPDGDGVATVRNLRVDVEAGTMGDIPLDNVMHFGIQIPIVAEQQRRYTYTR